MAEIEVFAIYYKNGKNLFTGNVKNSINESHVMKLTKVIVKLWSYLFKFSWNFKKKKDVFIFSIKMVLRMRI